jgi:hypothetical protein
MRPISTYFTIVAASLIACIDYAGAAPCVDHPYPGETVTDFITRSLRISLVRVETIKDVPDTEWEGDNVEFIVADLGTIKGKGPKRFSLRGLRSANADQLKFRGKPADHASLGLMTYRTIGGQGVMAQRKRDDVCEFVPVMKAGHSYLVFSGGPATSKSFEEIRDYQTDQWYASVLQELVFQHWEKHHPEDGAPRNR